jgi:hypothetical protein
MAAFLVYRHDAQVCDSVDDFAIDMPWRSYPPHFSKDFYEINLATMAPDASASVLNKHSSY